MFPLNVTQAAKKKKPKTKKNKKNRERVRGRGAETEITLLKSCGIWMRSDLWLRE